MKNFGTGVPLPEIPVVVVLTWSVNCFRRQKSGCLTFVSNGGVLKLVIYTVLMKLSDFVCKLLCNSRNIGQPIKKGTGWLGLEKKYKIHALTHSN